MGSRRIWVHRLQENSAGIRIIECQRSVHWKSALNHTDHWSHQVQGRRQDPDTPLKLWVGFSITHLPTCLLRFVGNLKRFLLLWLFFALKTLRTTAWRHEQTMALLVPCYCFFSSFPQSRHLTCSFIPKPSPGFLPESSCRLAVVMSSVLKQGHRRTSDKECCSRSTTKLTTESKTKLSGASACAPRWGWIERWTAWNADSHALGSTMESGRLGAEADTESRNQDSPGWYSWISITPKWGCQYWGSNSLFSGQRTALQPGAPSSFPPRHSGKRNCLIFTSAGEIRRKDLT